MLNMKVTSITPKLEEGESVNLSLYDPRQRTNIRLYGLACKDWTPLMVTEYKKKWEPNGIEVRVWNWRDSVDWCRLHLFHHQFYVVKHANPDDSHNIYFENPGDAMLFKLANSG